MPLRCDVLYKIRREMVIDGVATAGPSQRQLLSFLRKKLAKLSVKKSVLVLELSALM